MTVTPPWGTTRQSVGAFGEEMASRYLAGLGWQVVERNWRCPSGEIDIVAIDGPELVICEVKTRRGLGLGDPVEAVTPPKHRRLRQLAGAWLQGHPAERGRPMRIDVIGVVLEATGGRVHHVRGVIP
ncbi:MAG: YraN family protein [Tetrasphaera sp.]